MVLLQFEEWSSWVCGGVCWVELRCGPEDWVVVWEEGEEDAEEEACCCSNVSILAPTMQKR